MPSNEISLGICSIEKDDGVTKFANLMKSFPLEPSNDQQLPGCIGPYKHSQVLRMEFYNLKLFLHRINKCS